MKGQQAKPNGGSDDRLDALTVEETARRLRLSKQRVYQLVREKRLRCLRFGRRTVRIPVMALEEMLLGKVVKL